MINRIKVNNFKCFEAATVKCKELSLFTGLNGMGKSTVIQAILLFRQTVERNSFGADRRIILNGHYVSLGTIKDISYWYKKNDEISLVIEEDDQIWECYYDQKTQALMMKENMVYTSKGSIAGKGFEYICAERLGPRRYYDNLEGERYVSTQIGSKGEHVVSSLYEIGDQSGFKVYKNMKNSNESSERLDLQVNFSSINKSPCLAFNKATTTGSTYETPNPIFTAFVDSSPITPDCE